jgi:hypothetical protein
MPFRAGEIRVFDRSGAPMGSLTGFSVTGPRTWRINEPDDFGFTMPRNDGPVPIIYAASVPTIVGSRTVTATGTAVVADPSGVRVGDTLVALVAYDRNGASVTVATPAGWRSEARDDNGSEVGLRVLTRAVAAGDPANRSFVNGGGGAICVALFALRGVRRIPAGAVVTGSALGLGTSTASTTHRVGIPAGTAKGFTLVAFAGNGSATWSASGLTERVDTTSADLTLYVGTRSESRDHDSGGTFTATSSQARRSAGVALSLQATPGTWEMLQPDNLVLIESEAGLPAWGGYIEDPSFTDNGAQVRCLGPLGLLSKLNVDHIEQKEGEAYDAARRLVEGANAKKAAHGDLTIDMERVDSKALYGIWTYDGDIERGLQKLANDTVSEFYFSARLDSRGHIRFTLHWGTEFDVDKTAVLLRDGPGGNLSPGTTISFAGAERTNYARLVGTRTDIAEHLDYPAVMNLTSDIVPEVSIAIPAPEMPGARRRERLDVSVEWGLPEKRQKKLARKAQKVYLDYYKKFLHAYHARFGMPFIEGFEWGGMEPDQFRKFSGDKFRSFMRMATVNKRSAAKEWDPDSDADVTFEGWAPKWVGSYSDGAVGVAVDYTSAESRWLASRSAIHPLLADRQNEDYDVKGAWMAGIAVGTGEQCIGITSHPARQTSLWVMTATGSKTHVREWDTEARTMVREWALSSTAIRGLAAETDKGLMWTLTDGGVIQKRDLNSGILIETFATGLPNGAGISVSGPIVYAIARNGTVEMRFTKDGLFAATTDAAGALSKVNSLLVDVRQTEVWVTTEDGEMHVFSAAIALDEMDGPGPVDGAPGFDKIWSGTFVRLVMTDTRDLGKPGDPLPGTKGIQPVLHRNQMHDAKGNAWKWPSGWSQSLNSGNCVHAAGAMLLDRHTNGAMRKTPVEVRVKSGDKVGYSGLTELYTAFAKFGKALGTQRGTFKWSDDSGASPGFLQRIKAGRGAVVMGDYGSISKPHKPINSTENHAVYVHAYDDGDFIIHDPNRNSKYRWPSKVMKDFSAKTGDGYSHFGPGYVYCMFSKVTKKVKAKKEDLGSAKSAYVVWSKGNWKDRYVPGAPGEPARVVREWDIPGEQRRGFYERSELGLAVVEQVVYGEEGRVGDWNPVLHGYGEYGNGLPKDHAQHDPFFWYVSRDGEAMRGRGWHLVPWDVPIEEFAVTIDDAGSDGDGWPEGKAYLQEALRRFNREQGAQVLGVVNISGVWAHLRLGGRYSLSVSSQGPFPGGVTAEVRAVALTVDETSGVAQVLTEWLG